MTSTRATTATPNQSKALSLHIGLNSVDPKAYEGWDGPLAACEFDARDMAAIAKSKGMASTTLLTKKATRKATLAALRKAAAALKKGDFFFLSYSGHGGQVPDTNQDEADRKDETWCLFDGQLIDDELYFELSRFAAGVRVLVLSDSCHSGTVTRDRMPPPPPPGQRPKLMPDSVGRRVYAAHAAMYDRIQADVAAAAAAAAKRERAGDRAGERTAVDPDAALALLGNVGAAATATTVAGRFKPAVILISGCQDNQTSMDGDHNGAFTEQLLRVWNRGSFKDGYARFHALIRAALPPTQSPNLFTLGPAAAFLKQAPFTV